MSAWKSRWSWVRLVNTATSKWIASARCSDQRVRGDLHRAGAVAARRACGGRSPAGRSPPASSAPTSSAAPPTTCFTVPSSPHRMPGRLEDLADQEGGRRLAVGAGHADHPQPRRRVALEARRQRRHRRPRVGDHDLRHRQLQLALDDQRRRPRLDHVAARTRGRRRCSPATQKNSVPGPALRLSKARSPISTAASPTTRSTPGAPATSSSSLMPSSLIAPRF